MNTKTRKLNGAEGTLHLVFPTAPKLLVVAVALACSSAYGATRTWDTGTGTWSSAAGNWGDSGWPSFTDYPAPVTNDDVVINPSGNSAKTVTYAGTGYTGNALTINSLTFSNGSTADILEFTGGTLSVTGSFTANSSSIVKVNSGATLNLNGASSLSIFNLAGTLGGSGTVTVNGAMTWSGGTMSGTGTTNANNNLNITGSTILQRTLSGNRSNGSSNLTVSSGGTLDIQADKNVTFDGTISNAGTLKKTTTGGTTTINGNGAVTNTGTIIANSGTLSFTDGVTGTTGTLQTTGGTLSLGTTNNSTTGTLNIGAGGLQLNGKTLTVSTDYINSNFGTGNSFSRTASVTTGAGGAINAANISGGAIVGSFQQLSVNGGAKTASNATLALGNIHVGTSISQNYIIYNEEAAGGVTLRGAIQGSGVDSRLSGAGVDVTGSSWSATAGGNTGNKAVTLTGSSAGAVNSSVNIVNNFANTNSQTLTITGGVFQYAQLGAPSSVTFTNRHVGDAASQALSITNTNSGAPAGYQELLNASITGSNGSATGSGSFTSLGVGAINNSNLTVGLSTIAAGAQSGTVTITPVSNGTGTSGLGNTTRTAQVVNVSGNVYQYAQPTFTGSNPVNFGIVHIGDTASQSIGLANTSHAPVGYQEKLNASISTASSGITTAGSPISLAQGASSNALSVGIDTASAGSRSGTATVALVSDGAGTSGLGTTNLASQNISVSGQVNNYAAVGLTQTAGTGSFSGSGTSYVFDLGTITFGTGSAAGSLSLANTGGSALYTDLLSGTFNLAGVTNFTLTGFNSFTGLQGGSSLGLGVALNNNALGSFEQYVTLTPTGYNASGYSGGLSPITLALKGEVVAAVPEPASYAMLIAGLGLMAGIARRRRQQA